MALKDTIVAKTLENRVTLIDGETGCENMKPILCTQPRRFVVVAKMVAKARNCELGTQAGYHIGHSKLILARSEIVFKIAGVLLDEMREKGLNALNYKAIILDEVHERSVESDLVLVCMFDFFTVVLMSATADTARYRDYFKDLGRGERVEVFAISISNQPTFFQRRVSYLEQDPDIKPEVHRLIFYLILHIHENEPDIEKGIFVFLPTYHDLEQHIDIQQALMAMKVLKSHRKVILATNIAESSVTIPKVAYWEGRSGRTCDGQIYQLVTRSFFKNLEDHECPSILRLSLRQQVLLMCCVESRAINDPKGMILIFLVQKALDPPDPEFIEDALNLLPTFYGQSLASFSLAFDASVLLLKFAEAGLLQKGILLGRLIDTQPQLILCPFGEEHLYTVYAYRYYGGDCNYTVQIGQKEMILIGNLGAYQFWQRIFKDKHRLQRLKHLLKIDEMKATTVLLPKIEEEWCTFHNLVQPSLHNVSEIYEDILNSLHRFRPKFLGTCNDLLTYYDSYEFKHTCLLKCQPKGDFDTVAVDDEPSQETRKCFAVPFVAPSHFQTIKVAETFIKTARLVISMSILLMGLMAMKKLLCIYFMKGSCNRGSQCLFSHSAQERKEIHAKSFSLYKYFTSVARGCPNGETRSCSHVLGPSLSSFISTPCMPEDGGVNAASLMRFLPTSSDGRALLLDGTDLRFCNRSLTDIRIMWGLHHPYQTIISTPSGSLIPWTDALYEVQVILTMNNIKFSLLQVEKLGRDSFFFLGESDSFPFDEESFGQMSNIVTTRKPMMASKPISYVFTLQPPDVQFGNTAAILQKICSMTMGRM
ncbi:DExH-box ATP-dependent RNA helicase [Salix suchowensis]|nr:DExH-box ATP-dependent RNA helicase [Salix suchowensis]